MEDLRTTKKIAMIGGPGSGKSTAAADLFVQLKKLGKNVELVPEWIRRDIHQNGLMETLFEQYRTMLKHRQAEENFPSNVEYIISDGNTLLPYIYTAVYSTKEYGSKDRLVLGDMYESLLKDLYLPRYDHIFVIPRHFTEGSHLDDGTRFQTTQDNEVLEKLIMMIFTEIHRMDNVTIVDCPLEERAEFFIRHLFGHAVVEDWRQHKVKELM